MSMKFKMYTIEIIGSGYLPNNDNVELGHDYVQTIVNAFLTTDLRMVTDICNQIQDDGFNAVVRTITYEVE